MKIGIEAQRIFRKKKHGMDMVALELVRNLQKIDQVNEYLIFVKPDEDMGALKSTHNFTIVPVEGGAYPLWEQFALPAAAKKSGCDILHCTSNTAPVNSSIPLVTTLHDIIYMESSYWKILTGDGNAYQRFGNMYRRLVVPRVVKRSRRIITVSHFEKNRIAHFFAVHDNNKLKAVYNGVSSHFKPETDREELARVKEKYHLPDNYLFFLGNTDPKKNTRGVLKAFSDFRKQINSDYKLVMLDYDQHELQKLLNEIGDPSLINHIVLTGYVVNTDLPNIYRQCRTFLYPSLRESFGIPMLEAMACATPVITSNTSSMPEVAGNAALIVDPFKPEEITAAMINLHHKESIRLQLVEAGLHQAAKFSWNAMARDVLHIYNELYAEIKHHSSIKYLPA